MNKLDKVAVVTGAGQGIGAACGACLAEAGFSVALMCPSGRSVSLAKQLGGVGIRGSVLCANDLERLVEVTKARYGRIDAVVNNMGHSGAETALKNPLFDKRSQASILDIDDAVWHSSLEMYVLSVVRMARLAMPLMQVQGGGSIVNISSFAVPEPRAMYPMSVLRAALHGFTKLFADRYARDGVRMNNLLPGFCENHPTLSELVLDSIPMGRTARLEEIGRVCVFLASDASSYITGQNLLVDGGVNRAVT